MKKGRFPKWASVVFRSDNIANANGGVSYAHENYDAANVNAVRCKGFNRYIL